MGVQPSDSKHDLPVAENLLDREFNPSAPDQAWSSDITYIATDEGWLYLVAVIDLFSRQVVGWIFAHHFLALAPGAPARARRAPKHPAL